MPLASGSSEETIRANIAKLLAEGYPPDQAAAIAYAVAERSDLGGGCYGVEPGRCEACGRPLLAGAGLRIST